MHRTYLNPPFHTYLPSEWNSCKSMFPTLWGFTWQWLSQSINSSFTNETIPSISIKHMLRTWSIIVSHNEIGFILAFCIQRRAWKSTFLCYPQSFLPYYTCSHRMKSISQCCSNWNTSSLKYVFEIHLMHFVTLTKSNLYFVIEIQLECILCHWNTFLCKILKIPENNTSAGCIRFHAVLGFSQLPFIYHILNCHSVDTKLKNMFMFLFIY